jgi:RNA polymerase primary sigma factor
MFKSPLEKQDLEQYLKEVSRFPLLTPEAEKELGRRARKGNREAVRKLVEGNLRFVIHYAKKFVNPGVSIMDLINEGNLALIYAAQRFDPDRDIRFVTYAGWWLRQAMMLALSKDTPMALSPRTLGQIYRMERAAASLRRDLHRMPTVEEVAEELGLPEREVLNLQQAGMDFLSLSGPSGEDPKRSLADVLPEKGQLSPDYQIIKRGFEQEMREVVDELPENEQKVIRLRFGLGGDGPFSLQAIGDRLNVSRERVRQLENRALKRLRAFMQGRKLEGYLN